METSARLLPDGTILGILRDLTEREEAERRIRRSEAFYRTLLESAYEVTTLVDEDGMIRYQSPAIRRVLGYEPGDLAGVSAWSRVHPDDLPVAREAWDQALAEPGRPVDLEVRLMSASGEWRTVAASVTDRRDSSSISAIVV
ncbi:MAG: PAS domain S-box protein, partial [Gammaproteobacteria bacterium]|nr:PAS domain-containing protein [Gemmatimonadota bacterium]NIU75746.1 PAS domain S-box protein [Gammaproteobacteria bacterium]